VICIGVIQHTPSPEDTIEKLCKYVKPGGMLIIDHYTYNYPFTVTRKLLRWILLKTSPTFSLKFSHYLVAYLWPFHKLLWRLSKYKLFRLLRQYFLAVSPVIDYHDAYSELGEKLLYSWALLDTHDTLTDVYKHFRSKEEIVNVLKSNNMIDIYAEYGGNGVEARARKPI